MCRERNLILDNKIAKKNLRYGSPVIFTVARYTAIVFFLSVIEQLCLILLSQFKFTDKRTYLCKYSSFLTEVLLYITSVLIRPDRAAKSKYLQRFVTNDPSTDNILHYILNGTFHFFYANLIKASHSKYLISRKANLVGISRDIANLYFCYLSNYRKLGQNNRKIII